ncbi:2748_t:CDS:2, partial [Scutellospora calospora]
LDLAESYKAKFINKGRAYNKPNNLPKLIDCRATQLKAKIANIKEQTYDNHNAELTYLEDNKERLLKFKDK